MESYFYLCRLKISLLFRNLNKTDKIIMKEKNLTINLARFLTILYYTLLALRYKLFL